MIFDKCAYIINYIINYRQEDIHYTYLIRYSKYKHRL